MTPHSGQTWGSSLLAGIALAFDNPNASPRRGFLSSYADCKPLSLFVDGQISLGRRRLNGMKRLSRPPVPEPASAPASVVKLPIHCKIIRIHCSAIQTLLQSNSNNPNKATKPGTASPRRKSLHRWWPRSSSRSTLRKITAPKGRTHALSAPDWNLYRQRVFRNKLACYSLVICSVDLSLAIDYISGIVP
jgi:hypothetical protein